jgi:hypothetical protein
MDPNITARTGRSVRRVGPVAVPRGSALLTTHRSATAAALERKAATARDNFDANEDKDTTANNDQGKPTTPADVMPDLPTPDAVVPEDDREDETTAAEKLGEKTQEGAGMAWLDELGS